MRLPLIDFVVVESIKGFRYLSRSDKKTEGMIEGYKVFIKPNPFKLKKNCISYYSNFIK